MSPQDMNALFTSALNTVNAALDAHSDEMPFKQILSAADRVLEDRQLGVAVYKNDPGSPHDYFTIRFRNNAFEVVSHGKESPEIDGKVSVEYLEQLANDPDRYIESPLKLDLDWLTSRLGLD
ncbi:MAG TPA: hypothetical protein VKA74_14990 [Myxococcota bacterium]|nr:hypothetical protein [Myxococcota bacterium]